MKKFKIYLAGGSVLQADKTLIMGILNATPDSFSDGGDLDNPKQLKERIRQMLAEGADILDVGGESTRPGHGKVEADEELARIIPVIKTIRGIAKDIPISVDTQKAAVAAGALEAGADIINDISALSDKKMAGIVKQHNCSIILMRNEPTGMDTVAGCREQFKKILKKAENQGLDKKYLLLDAGLGFGDLKTGNYKVSPGSDPHANVLLIINIDKYSLGMPVVIGASRKRFIGDMTGVENAKDRLAGSLAAAVMAEQAGAAIIRVHDVAETVSAFRNIHY